MAEHESTNQSAERGSTADKPTPMSTSTQQFGNQTGQTNKPQSTQDEVKQAGREVANDAKNAVDNATREVKDQVKDIRKDVQQQTESFLSEQKDVAAERVGGVADALRQAGQGLAEHDEDMLARYTDSLAGQLDNFSNTLRDREIGSLVKEAKQMAYRQPELFVVGALAAGFALGRFFKSSTQSRDNQYGYEGYNSPDPRGDARNFGEPYGQQYANQFNANRGPYGDRSTEFGSSQAGNSQRGSSQGGSSQGGSSQGGSSQSGNSQWNESGRPYSGLGVNRGSETGQSVQPQNTPYKGQEFGQGNEQMSEDPTNVTPEKPTPGSAASSFATGPNTRTDQGKQEGERK